MSFSHLYHDVAVSRLDESAKGNEHFEIARRPLEKLLKSKHLVLDNPGRSDRSKKNRPIPGYHFNVSSSSIRYD